MKLISMTDFVLEQKKNSFYGQIESSEILQRIEKYAEFLKQPLTLGFFAPTDENGNLIEFGKNSFPTDEEMKQFQKSKEKVLFKDVNMTAVEDYFIVKIGKREVWISWTKRTIEDVQHINRAYEIDFELTHSALKQIFGDD